MTAQTYNFLNTSYFQAGQTNAIGSARMRDFVDTVNAVGHGALTPEMFGAVGNGTTDDAAAFNACSAAALSQGTPIYMSAKVYRLNSTWDITDTSGNTQKRAVCLIQGAGYGDGSGLGTTLLWGGASGGTVVTHQNVTNQLMRDFCIDCNNIAQTGLNVAYSVTGTGQDDPSADNNYTRIQIRNYIAPGPGFIADSCNDTTFDHVLMDSPNNKGVPTLRMNGGGGPTFLRDCVMFSGPLQLNVQSATLINCETGGIQVIAPANINSGVLPNWRINCLSLSGGYIYPNPATHITFEILSGAESQAMAFFGTHFENDTTFNASTGAGCYFGGAGRLDMGALIFGCDITTTNSAAPRLVNPNLISGPSGNPSQHGRFIVMGGTQSGTSAVDWTQPTNFDISRLWQYQDTVTGSTQPDMLILKGLVNATNDSGAAAGGVPVGGTYRNGSVLMTRVV